MIPGGLIGNLYHPLSDGQIKKIHGVSLNLLETTGIKVESEKALKILEKGGAKICQEENRVRFPRKIIEKYLRYAPEAVTLCGRKAGQDLVLEKDRVYLGTGGAAIFILDPETGLRRETVLSDLFRISRLVDSLENIHFLVRPCIARDVPEKDMDVNHFYACLSGTTKHVMAGVSCAENVEKIVSMAAKIAGSEKALVKRPFISFITSAIISPMRFASDVLDILTNVCEKGIPVALSAAPMAGSTSPVTMAGTLAQLHAEEMAAIAFTQMVRKGSPVLYGGIPSLANFANMGYSGGPVECGMMNAAITQLAHHIHVPNYNSAGLTDSKVPDAQAGYEKAMTILLAAMAGSNYIHHSAGMLESMLAVADEQYVIDNDIIGSCLRVLKGIEVTKETLAQKVIATEGVKEENYLSCEHTVNHMRSEYFLSNLADRQAYPHFEAGGKKDLRQRAKEEAKRLLLENKAPLISETADQAIRAQFNILLKKGAL